MRITLDFEHIFLKLTLKLLNFSLIEKLVHVYLVCARVRKTTLFGLV